MLKITRPSVNKDIDFKKSASLGDEYRINWLREEGDWCKNMPN